MCKVSCQGRKHLEVAVMFEPHRRQDDLLRAASTSLIPQLRSRLASEQPSLMAPLVYPPRLCGERNKQ
jgi:hypothetical protein